MTAEPPGIVVHRSSTLRPRDIGRLRGVPVTSPVATLLALAGALSEKEVEAALLAAVFAGSVAPRELRDRVRAEARKGRRGPAVLRRLLAESDRPSHVSSALEDLVGCVLAECGLSMHREHAVPAAGRIFYVDFAFPEAKVAVEADGRRWHSDPAAFERDRAKQNALTAAGWRILRVTDRQIRDDPAALCDQVRKLVGMDPGNRR